MGTTNRAEELAEEYAKQFDWAEDSSPYLDFIEGFNASNKLRQSEIDELTKEVERLRKGIDWTRAEYIKCVNDSDEITEKLEELLTTH